MTQPQAVPHPSVDSAVPSVLRLDQVKKSFAGIIALDGLSLEVAAGEVVALVGDNGAGKSTLVRIIAGIFRPTSGRIILDGEEVSFVDPNQSQDYGIQVVHQDLALAETQTVYMNLFLGREATVGPFRRLDRQRMIRETDALVRGLDVRIPSPTALVRDLSGGQRQGIAIARATHWATKLILMDEPTAALGVAETMRVEKIIETLRDRGMAILIVSHSLDQVFRLSERICVLRRGVQIGIRKTSETSKNEIVSMITGLA